MSKMKRVWTDEEIALLKANYLEHDQRQLHEKFFPDKSIVQIRNKKMSLNLKKPPVWSTSEREALLKHGANYSHSDLARIFFKDKTPRQVHDMRKHLGVRRLKNQNKDV